MSGHATGEEVSAVVAVSTAFVLSVAITMFGIYMIRQIDTGLTQTRKELDLALRNNQQLNEEVRRLKVEVQVEKDRIHRSDA